MFARELHDEERQQNSVPGPKHTAAEVVLELEQGLRAGTILLRDGRESPIVEERKTVHFRGEFEIAAVLGTLLLCFWVFHQGIDNAVTRVFQKLTAPAAPTQVNPR